MRLTCFGNRRKRKKKEKEKEQKGSLMTDLGMWPVQEKSPAYHAVIIMHFGVCVCASLYDLFGHKYV